MWLLIIASVTVNFDWKITTYDVFETQQSCEIAKYLVKIEHEVPEEFIGCIYEEEIKPGV